MPDPILARPYFSQSSNPYTYAENSPLAYVDPTGFQVEEQSPSPILPPGVYVTCDANGQVQDILVVGSPRKRGPRESAETGTSKPPTDVGVIGDSSGFSPQPSPTESEEPGEPNIAGEVEIGVAEGVGGLLFNAGKTLVLNALTLGAYSTYELGMSIWAGYKEAGSLGAVNAVNPFYAILKGAHDTYAAAASGDHRAAGRIGIVTAIVVAATVVGVKQGAAALTGKSGAAGGATAKAAAGEAGATKAAATSAREVGVSRSRFPESAKHIADAQAAGKSPRLTIDRGGAAARRKQSLGGTQRTPGLDRDEYPPAMFKEGGAGASARPISPGDNRGAGACIGGQCRGMKNGTKVTLKVTE